MNTTTLPQRLEQIVGAETKEFAVKTTRLQPIKKTLSLFIFGTFWLTITGIVGFAFFGPILMGEEVHFTSNGVPGVAGPGNLKPLMMPGIIVIVFTIIGVALLIGSINILFSSGGYFVGTPTRLIFYNNGISRSIDWEQFSGDIEVSGTDQKGTIAIQMRTGTTDSDNNYTPGIVYICGVPDVFEIEQICRKRIKENDPTPVSTNV